MTLAAATYIHKATYWGSPTQGGFGGITFSAPRVISCRWEDKIEVFTNNEGVEQRSRAIVFTFEDLEIGGYLLKGTSVGTDPTVISGAKEIQRSDDQPDLRGLHSTYKTYL